MPSNYRLVNISFDSILIGMRNNLIHIIERLANLRKSMLRQQAAQLGMQLVHAEILEYLAVCNRYSNTPLAIVEYLGQTKGSVSQSIKWLENKKLIKRRVSAEDKRSVRLQLTAAGNRHVEKFRKALPDLSTMDEVTEAGLISMLHSWQQKEGRKGFLVCNTCKFNESLGGARFRCGLTGEELSTLDINKICREHEYD